MKYVIGVDLGTSAVKVILINKKGEVRHSVSKTYPLIQERSGYSEQNPEDWVENMVLALRELVQASSVRSEDIEGMSFSGQMHGLVLLNQDHRVIRHAILWNDTRTSKQCRMIERLLGDRLLQITKNPAIEGFTLPKILWVKEHEPEYFKETAVFLLPKDYLRYRLTGEIHSEYSDAAGTLMLDVAEKKWSPEICEVFGIDRGICPPLVESHDCVGTVLPKVAEETGLNPSAKVFAGGADNACGAVGSGILSEGETFCSIGTSGVILSYEQDKQKDYAGKLHFFNHSKEDAYYVMGVTLGAGYSLNWFKDTFAKEENFDELLNGLSSVSIGANGLLFTPYLAGERTPHADANIRGSFIGIDGSHTREDFTRAIVEGITFSLNESIDLLKRSGKVIDRIFSIGGGAKNEAWLQIQADVFNATIVQLEYEEGPGMGAAMLAAYGSGWFTSLEQCAKAFIKPNKFYDPKPDNVAEYKKLFPVYKKIYGQTKSLNKELKNFRSPVALS